MGYKCTFIDDDIYTAQDVNEALSNITRDGVAIFSDSGDALHDLNTAISEVVDAGTLYESCKVVKVGTSYLVSKGTCFLYDGSQITFDDDGYQFDIESGVKNYVYIKRNILGNRIDVVVSQTDGDDTSVPLAVIDENGNIEDKRKFATSKLLPSTANIVTEHHIEFPNTRKTEEIYDVGWAGFRYLIIKNNSKNTLNCYDLAGGVTRQVETRNGATTFVLVRKSGRYLIFTEGFSYLQNVDLYVEVV